MANLAGFINPTAEVPKAGGALPADWYASVIIESEERDNYDKDGREYQFTYEVIEGPYKGRKFWHTIAKTGNPSRVGKGQGELNAIIAATGVQNPQDTSDLHYKPMLVRLSFVAAGTTSGSGNVYQKDRNFLNEWKPHSANAAGANPFGQPQQAPQAGAASQTTTSPSEGGKPFWAGQAA